MATLAKKSQKKKERVKSEDDKKISEEELDRDFELMDNDFNEIVSFVKTKPDPLVTDVADPKIEDLSFEPPQADNASLNHTTDSSLGDFVEVAEPESIIIASQEQVPSAPVFDSESFQVPKIVLQQPTVSAPTFTSCLTDLHQIHRMNDYFVNIAGMKPLSKLEWEKLYFNPLEKEAQELEEDFVEEELNRENTEGSHSLFRLLVSYARAKQQIKANIFDITEAKSANVKKAGQVWEERKEVAKVRAYCLDGKGSTLTETYRHAFIRENVMNDLVSGLKNVTQLVLYQYIDSLFQIEISRHQIENTIRDLLSGSPSFLEVCNETPVHLGDETSVHLEKPLNDIRVALSILFAFLRRPILDSGVIKDVKDWIRRLGTLLLRFATWRDHLFLLHHVLRCPIEVSSWAVCLIQVPTLRLGNSPFDSLVFHHVSTLLTALLSPTQKRNEFLSRLIDPVADDVWVLVDSDGEDNGSSNPSWEPRENDIVALFHQIPLQVLFGAISCAVRKDDGFYVNSDAISGHHTLQSIAFGTKLIEFLGVGLQTYEGEKYRQFSKRLARTIKDVVQYVSEIQEILNASSRMEESTIRLRIHLEHNLLVLKACYWIFKSQRVGSWQFLVAIPFELLSKEALYKLYYAFLTNFEYGIIEDLNTDFAEKVREPEFLNSIMTRETAAEDIFYLLQLLGAMAGSRGEQDWNFVQDVVKGMYQIGVIIPNTRETCHKTVEDLFHNLACQFPAIISFLLEKIKSDISKPNLQLSSLVKGLPLEIWRPHLGNLELLSQWLLNSSFESTESQIARIIFNRLNWNFTGAGLELFLPREIHLQTAFLICEVAGKHVPETIGLTGILGTALVKNQVARQQFSHWCWNMVSRLRLHVMDQELATVQSMLLDPVGCLARVPEVDSSPAICQGIGESRPLAIFLSILVTMCGHSVPQICEQGFDYLKLLLNDSRHAIVIRCLELTVPLFLSCPESLSHCDKFQNILSTLLNDKTYARHTKDFVVLNTPKPILKLMSDMLQAQVINYPRLGLQSPASLISLWLQSLTYNSSWFANPNSVCLVDVLLKVAYQFTDAWITSRNRLEPLLKTPETFKQAVPSGIMGFLGASGSGNCLQQPSSTAPWLSLMCLELEFESLELENGVWYEVLRQLYMTSKPNLNDLLKKIASLTGTTPFSASFLVVFKIASLITTCSLDNPVLLIFCQQFFSLYLARIPITPGDHGLYEVFGVSEKFYEHNPNLMKKVKKKLQEAQAHHLSRSVPSKDSPNSNPQFHNDSASIFRAFEKWLEDFTISKLTPGCIPNSVLEGRRLLRIFEGNRAHWTEFIDGPAIRRQQLLDAAEWSKVILRPVKSDLPKSSSFTNPVCVTNHGNPKARILDRLESYELPKSAPFVFDILSNKPHEKTYLKQSAFRIFQTKFMVIRAYAEYFEVLQNEHQRLDMVYLGLIGKLYTFQNRVVMKKPSCGNDCRGAGNASIQFIEATINSAVRRDMDSNRQLYDNWISKTEMKPPDRKLIQDVADIMEANQHLAEGYRKIRSSEVVDPQYREKVQANGINLFYEALSSMQEKTLACPITRELCNHCANTLGIFIRDNQNEEGFKLLKIAMNQPELINILNESFVPTLASPPYFTKMYQQMIEQHFKKCDPSIVFVLFSKFDIQLWLKSFDPDPKFISQLIHCNLRGLECWNQAHLTQVQSLLQRHLVHLFEFKFPSFTEEVLTKLLQNMQFHDFNPEVLLDLLRALYQLNNGAAYDESPESFASFASSQKILACGSLQSLIRVFIDHFEADRRAHGLHGLYPRYLSHTKVLRGFIGTLAFAFVDSAVAANEGMPPESLANVLWNPLWDLFSPWIAPYFLQDTQVSNWMKQLVDNQILQPWSKNHVTEAQSFLQLFVSLITYMLNSVLNSQILLGYVFDHYEGFFANKLVTSYVLLEVHSALLDLPWEKFHPLVSHLHGFHRVLQQFLPESHAFVGKIFVRVDWTSWLELNFSDWDFEIRQKVVSALLTILLKLPLEPSLKKETRLEGLLKEALFYPWQYLDHAHMEAILDWFILSADPLIALKLPGTVTSVDSTLLQLLLVSCGLGRTDAPEFKTQMQHKRVLYVRTLMRLLKDANMKYQSVLASSEGVKGVNTLVMELMSVIENVTKDEPDVLREAEVTSLVSEVLNSLVSQSAEAAKKLVDALISWQLTSNPSDFALSGLLIALNNLKVCSFNTCILLESTISSYLRYADSTEALMCPSWTSAMQKTTMFAVTAPDLKSLAQHNMLLCLHLYAILRLKSMTDNGERLVFCQSIFMHVERLKTTERTEARWFLLVGLFVQLGIPDPPAWSTLLLPIARTLVALSSQNETWGEGILGAIGLKKDSTTNSKRILTRSLACFIFGLYDEAFPDYQKVQAEFRAALEDLRSTTASKKFSDVRTPAVEVIRLLQGEEAIEGEVRPNAARIIRLFYKDQIFDSVEDVWI